MIHQWYIGKKTTTFWTCERWHILKRTWSCGLCSSQGLCHLVRLRMFLGQWLSLFHANVLVLACFLAIMYFISQLATPLLWQVYIHCFLEGLMATISKSRHHRSSNIQLSWSGAVRLVIPALEQWKITSSVDCSVHLYINQSIYLSTVSISMSYLFICLPVSICAHVCVKVYVHIGCKIISM